MELGSGRSSSSGAPGLGEAQEQDGFYMLKKDSQRRSTLTTILRNDEAKICDEWYIRIKKDCSETVLKLVSKTIFLCGLRPAFTFLFQIVVPFRTLSALYTFFHHGSES